LKPDCNQVCVYLLDIHIEIFLGDHPEGAELGASVGTQGVSAGRHRRDNAEFMAPH